MSIDLSILSRRVLGGFLVYFLSLSVYAEGPTCHPFELIDGRIVFPIEIEGIQTKAAVDTGFILHSISNKLVERLGLSANIDERFVQVGPLGDSVAAFTVSKVKGRFLGSELVLADLLAKDMGEDVDISFGLGLFQNAIVQINYPKSCMLLLPRDSIDLRKVANLKIRHSDFGQILVQAKINDKSTVWFALRTGVKAVLINRIYASTIGLLDQESETIAVTSLKKEGTYEQLQLNSLQFGPYTLGNVKASFPSEGESSNLKRTSRASTGSYIDQSADSQGSIGYDVLKHFVVTIDYKGKRAHIAAP